MAAVDCVSWEASVVDEGEAMVMLAGLCGGLANHEGGDRL